MAAWTDELGYKHTNGTNKHLVSCSSCKTAGWIKYTFHTQTWTGVGGTSSTNYTHLYTQTKGSNGNNGLDRFLIRTARAINDCGHPLKVVRVKATHNPDRPCDPRCAGATGPSCSCSCDGKNHGAAHAAWE